MVNVNAELPGSLRKKGSTMGYTAHLSCIQLLVKPEFLLGQ